jgi:hypothetical protein
MSILRYIAVFFPVRVKINMKILNRYIHLFIYLFLPKDKLITCCFWYVGSIPTQGMKIKLLVLEKIQQCISKYSYAVLYN